MFDLAETIRTQLLPWSRHNVGDRLIVARPKMDAAQMPHGVLLSRHKISGSRVIIKNRRYYSNTRSVRAVWPEAGLNEVNKFKMACVPSGHIDYQIGPYRLQCGPGHFLLLSPGTPHPDGSSSYLFASLAA